MHVLHVLADALAGTDPATATIYTDPGGAALPEAARASLEDLMSAGTYEYEYKSFVRKYVHQGRVEAMQHAILTVLDARGFTVTDDALMMGTGTPEYESIFLRKFVLQGRAEGAAHAILTALDARGFTVTDDARSRITACADFDQFDIWHRRAVTIERLEDLFA